MSSNRLDWERNGLLGKGAQIGYECMSDGVFFKLGSTAREFSTAVYSYQR
jgi:hypothetical protein